MNEPSLEQLNQLADDTGFRAELLEKVLKLLRLLSEFQKHPYLREKFVLKGGAALNAFLFNLPRLSADIDLNYVGEADVGQMKAERPRLEKAIEAVCAAQGLRVERKPTEISRPPAGIRSTSARASYE